MAEDVWTFRGHPKSKFDNEDLSHLVADFLALFSHQIVFHHSSASLPFGSDSFHGLLLKKCADPPILEYIDRAHSSLVKWIARGELRKFRVQIIARSRVDEHYPVDERRRRVDAEYTVNIERMAALSSASKQASFEMAELRKQMRESLRGMHLGRDQQHRATKPEQREANGEEDLCLLISCTLCSGALCLEKKGWIPVDSQRQNQFKEPFRGKFPVISPIPNIDTTVAKMVFLGKESLG